MCSDRWSIDVNEQEDIYFLRFFPLCVAGVFLLLPFCLLPSFMLYVHAFFSVNFFPVTLCDLLELTDLLMIFTLSLYGTIGMRKVKGKDKKAIKMHIYIYILLATFVCMNINFT